MSEDPTPENIQLPIGDTPDMGAIIKPLAWVGGIGCCLPMALIMGFVLVMLFLATIMQGCN